jgi:hypothetical protein
MFASESSRPKRSTHAATAPSTAAVEVTSQDRPAVRSPEESI